MYNESSLDCWSQANRPPLSMMGNKKGDTTGAAVCPNSQEEPRGSPSWNIVILASLLNKMGFEVPLQELRTHGEDGLGGAIPDRGCLLPALGNEAVLGTSLGNNLQRKPSLCCRKERGASVGWSWTSPVPADDQGKERVRDVVGEWGQPGRGPSQSTRVP